MDAARARIQSRRADGSTRPRMRSRPPTSTSMCRSRSFGTTAPGPALQHVVEDHEPRRVVRCSADGAQDAPRRLVVPVVQDVREHVRVAARRHRLEEVRRSRSCNGRRRRRARRSHGRPPRNAAGRRRSRAAPDGSRAGPESRPPVPPPTSTTSSSLQASCSSDRELEAEPAAMARLKIAASAGCSPSHSK